MEATIDSRRESEHFMPAGASPWQKKHPYEPSPDSYPQPVPLVSPSDLVNPMLTAGDLAEKGVRVCDPKLPLTEAIEILSQAESGILPVVAGGKPVGVLTEREVVAAVAKAPRDYIRLTVDAVMSRRFSKVRQDDRLEQLFDSFGTRGTLVVDRHGKLLGIIYWRNLADKFSERGLGKVLCRLLKREQRGHR
ncbi:MAG TPA: CBS domain-containing protein [Pirellulales bacterium]|nr:CBS domain-containing protein [Pirellulales bacterium]